MAQTSDLTSPASRQYVEDLYDSILHRGHIDFGDIPKSRGVLTEYKGYPQMKAVLDAIEQLCKDQMVANVMEYVTTIRDAMMNLIRLSTEYRRGYEAKCEYVMCEYQVYTYVCVEAITSILYEYVDYLKNPKTQEIQIVLKDTSFRANSLYIDTLSKYNALVNKNGDKYRRVLQEFNSKGKDNFVGVETLVGIGAVAAVLYMIIPVTRRAVYFIYKARTDIAISLDVQAKFLEMNAACIQASTTMDAAKKKSVIAKQKKISQFLRKVSDKLKVKSAKASREAQRELASDDRDFTTRRLNTNRPSTTTNTQTSSLDDDFQLL